MWKKLNGYFYFTSGQRRAVSILAIGYFALIAYVLWNYKSKENRVQELPDQEAIEEKARVFLSDSSSKGESLKPEEDKTAESERKAKTSPRVKASDAQFEAPLICINASDSDQFKQIRGLGPVYSGRIVRYREWLGGFHQKEQLKDVYGINDSLYREIRPRLTIKYSTLEKIPLNKAGFGELIGHPYIEREQVEIILNYRDHHGPFEKAEHLKGVDGLRKDWLERVLPYFEVK